MSEECAIWQHFDSFTEAGMLLELFILRGSVVAYFKTLDCLIS